MILQSLELIPFFVQKMILYQILVKIAKKTVSSDDIVQFVDDENFATYAIFD